MKTFKNLLIPLGTLILALIIIGGAAYAYEKEIGKNSQADSIINNAQNQFRQNTAEEHRLAALAQAQASLNAANARLAQLRAYLSPVAVLADAYDAFKKDAATLTTATAKVTGPKAAQFAKANQGLADTLQAFKILLSNIPPSGATDFQIAQAERFSQQVQTYINEINSLSSSLTPSNSGLTQNEISNIQTTTTTVSDSATKTSSDLTIALPPPADSSSTDTYQASPTGGNTSTTGNTSNATGTTGTVTNTTGTTTTTTSTVTAADIAAQQEIVNQLQNQVDQLQQPTTGGSSDENIRTADPGTLDTGYHPPLQVDQYGRPILIQGTNSDIYRGNQ